MKYNFPILKSGRVGARCMRLFIDVWKYLKTGPVKRISTSLVRERDSIKMERRAVSRVSFAVPDARKGPTLIKMEI